MIHSIYLITALLATVPMIYAQDTNTADVHADVQTQWKMLFAEFSEKKDKLETECKTASKQRQIDIRQKLNSLPREYAPRMLDCAKSNLSDTNAFDPLFWIVLTLEKGKYVDESLKLLKEHFADETDIMNLWMLLPELVKIHSDEVNPFLRSVLQNNSADLYRGSACLYLAIRLKNQAERTGDNILADESERLLRRAIDEFAKTRCRRGSVGNEAKRELKNLRGPLGIGHMAPNIKGKDLDGAKFSLADYRGKVVLLSFCGQWCVPCRKMYPHEQSLLDELAGKPFVFIEVNSDRDRIAHRKFMEENGYTWRCFGDGRQGPIASAWNIQASPTYFVLDHKGIIRYKAVGPVDEATLHHWTDTLINKRLGKRP